MEEFSERRKFKRIEVKLPVKYKLMKFEPLVRKCPGEIMRQTETLNISLGGMQIAEDINIREDEILRVEVKITKEPVKTYAKVRWSRFDKELNKYKAGLQFLYLKEKDKIKFDDIINN